MSKINKVTKKTRKKNVENHHGNVQYNYNAKEALATIIMNSFVDAKYYQSTEDGLKEIRAAIKKLSLSDPEFILKAAAYARQVGNMRTISQVAFVEAMQYPGCRRFARDYSKDIMYRADEPTECLAYHLGTYGKPIPNILKRIVKARYEDFDEYQLSKYQLKSKEFTLKDGILLTHPNLGEVGKKIIEGTASADTWERKLSTDGGENKKDAWEVSIPKMGYMALLRNLRNMIDEEVDMDLFKTVCSKIADIKQVKKSRQLPFRFYSAYRELSIRAGKSGIRTYYSDYHINSSYNKNQMMMATKALDAIANALDHSIHNLNLTGRSLVVCDSSGSMFTKISSNSSITAVEVGVLMGVCIAKLSDDSDFWLFDSNVKTVGIDRHASVISNVNKIVEKCSGGATYFHKVLDKMLKNNIDYDNIIVFSDMQVYGSNCWGSNGTEQTNWKRYNKKYPNASMTTVDITGYNRGNPLTVKDNVRLIAGWSDKIVELIANVDGSIVEDIENYKVKYK